MVVCMESLLRINQQILHLQPFTNRTTTKLLYSCATDVRESFEIERRSNRKFLSFSLSISLSFCLFLQTSSMGGGGWWGQLDL